MRAVSRGARGLGGRWGPRVPETVLKISVGRPPAGRAATHVSIAVVPVLYRVRPCVPCVPCVSRLPPVSFYRYCNG